jgi:hypothetical protein
VADTFADYIANGTTRGVAFRWVVEGLDVEFVSDLAMECDLADGRSRVRGLLLDGLAISETASIAWADLDLSMPTISIMETAGPYRDAATRAFTSWIGESNRTWLDAALTSSASAITVKDTSGITAGDVIHIGSETILVGTIASGTSLTGCTRGVWRTTAQAFEVERETTFGLDIDLIPVGSVPACLAGRRCWLYGHGLNELTDTSDSAGTLLWRGVLTADPELADALTWNVSVGSRLELFNAKIGSDKNGETRLRGIYYPDRSPFSMTLQRRSGANSTDAWVSDLPVTLAGFFETQAEFGAALAAAINAAMVAAGWTGSCSVEEWGEVWELFYTTAAATPIFVQFQGGSPVDGWFNPSDIRTASRMDAVGVLTTTVSASTKYRAGWQATGGTFIGSDLIPAASRRRVPRACYIDWIGALDTGSWPFGRWYLDRSAGFPASGSMIITPPAAEGESEPEPLPAITIVTSTGGYVEAADITGERREWAAAGETQPTIDVAIRFNAATGVNLADFMAALITAAPDLCNTGTMPLITSDDVASWSSEVLRAANGRPILLYRDYAFAKPQKLIDIVKHECRLLGLYLCLDSDGKIAVRELAPRTSIVGLTTIDATRHMPDGGSFGDVRMSPDGMIGAVLYKFQYDSREDKHLSPPYNFVARGIQATLRGKAGTLEIAPLVNPSSGALALPEFVQPQVSSLLALYGSRRYIYDVPVSMHCHDLRVGDGVLLTITQLPFVGQRGATTANTGLVTTRGTIVGRSWDYGTEPRGKLSIMVHGLDIAGYAPTARAASFSGAGTVWNITMAAAQYGPGGAINDASFFLVGDRVSLVEWDDDTPATYPGEVTGYDGANKLEITFDGGGFPGAGGSTWNLRFADSIDGISTAQKRYAYVAGSVVSIDYGGGDTRVARVFA